MLLVFIQLPADVLFGERTVDADRPDEVAPAPETFVGKEPSSLCKLVMKKNGGFAFQEAHDVCHTVAGRDGKDQVDVIGTCCAFDHDYFFLSRKLTDDLTRPLAYMTKENFLAVLGDDDDVVGTIPGDVGCMVECGSGHGKERESPLQRTLRQLSYPNPGTVEPAGVRRQSRRFYVFNKGRAPSVLLILPAHVAYVRV